MDAQNFKTSGQNVNDEMLSGKDFVNLLPHLEFNQLLRINFKTFGGQWRRLFDLQLIDGKRRNITCAVCVEEFPMPNLKEHMLSKSHLKVAANLHHSLYTSTCKSDIVKVSCIEDLFALEYQTKADGEFKQMIISTGRSWKKNYFCLLCDVHCGGIITVINHMRGNTHQLEQKNLHALRSKINENVNKSTVFVHKNAPVPEAALASAQATPHHHLQRNGVGNAIAIDAAANVAEGMSTVNEGLIGVEYVVRVKMGVGQYSYVCRLCPKFGSKLVPSESGFEAHLISFKHRFHYCGKHYPDTLKHYEQLIQMSHLPRSPAMKFILSKVAAAIEACHGYGTPYDVTCEYFWGHKNEIAGKLCGLPHACQEFGPSFSNIVDITDLHVNKKIILSARYVQPDNILTPRFTKPPPGKYYLNLKNHISKRSHLPLPHHQHHHDHNHDHVPSRKRRRTSQSFDNDHDYDDDNKIESCENVWRIYRQQISESASDLENNYLAYRRQPEKHPQYGAEWSSFWKRRKVELQEEGRNYRSYDFQPEWSHFFRQRLQQLFREELQHIKIETRRQLNIPLDIEEDANFYNEKRARSYAESLDDSNGDGVESEISDSGHLPKAEANPETSANAQTWQPTARSELDRPNVIGLLRLMTALDDHLGSTMGEKMLDLLTKALALEKRHTAEQFESRILTANNCRLIKSAQEKLRSQLYADLVESKKVKSFQRVIESAEILLNKAHEMGWSSVEEEQSTTTPTNMQIEQLLEVLKGQTTSQGGVGDVSKKAVGLSNQQAVAHKKPLTDTLLKLIGQDKLDSQQLGIENGATAMPTTASLSSSSFSIFPNANLRAQEANYSDFQANDNSSDVWRRLGHRMSYSQEFFQPGYYGAQGGFNSSNYMGENSAKYNSHGGY